MNYIGYISIACILTIIDMLGLFIINSKSPIFVHPLVTIGISLIIFLLVLGIINVLVTIKNQKEQIK